jgi:cell division septation protein DedD
MKGVVCGAWRVTWPVWLSLFFAACANTTPPRPTPHFLAWSQDRATTKRLCVLPFLDRTQTPGLATQVRQSVAGHLSVKHFADVELSDVDARLITVGKEWRNFSPQQIGRSISCDALLYGEVTNAGRLYLALYSQLTVAATVRLVDIATGQTLMQESYATKFREAGLPLSPLSIVPDVVKTWANLSETQMVRAIDDLGRNLAERVPNLPAPLPASPGQIAVTAAVSSPLPTATTSISGEATALATHNGQPMTTVAAATLSVPAPVSDATEKIQPPLPPHLATQRQYRLQVAAFRTYADAQRVVHSLRNKGYPAMITQTGESEEIWNRVVLGPFPSRAAAQKVGIAIRKIAPLSPVVIPRPRH